MQRISLVAISLSFFLFAVGCAQKQKTETTANTKVQKSIDKKANANANTTAKAKTKKYDCVVNKDKRTVVLEKQPSRCEVHYTKHGEQSQVAWAEATPSICTDVYNKIRENIESRGFKCEEAKPTTRKTASSDRQSKTK